MAGQEKKRKKPEGSKNNAPSSGGYKPRRERAQNLGGFVSLICRDFCSQKSSLLPRLLLDWEILVGEELAHVTEPRRVSRNVLTIGCTGPVAVELQYSALRVLRRINHGCGLYGADELQVLKLVQDFVPRPRPLTFREQREKRRRERGTFSFSAEQREILQKLEEPDLADAFRKLADALFLPEGGE